MSILAHGYLLVILLWSLCKNSLLFYKSWYNGVHNCLDTCLYALWSTLILNLMYIILFFSRFMFNEFIAKGEEIVYKVGWALANRVVERKKHDKWLSKGRACIKSVRESWFQGVLSFLILSFSWLFSLVCRFSYLLLVLWLFPFIDNLLKLFLAFLVFYLCFMGSWI
jgi:hypothetical protein